MDKIICLGKNYADHAKEMGDKPVEQPVLFLKPPSCSLELNEKKAVSLPWERGLIHHECEIVFKLYKKNIIGLALGLDLTLRDLQKKLKENGQPWEISKSFKNSALFTPFKALRDFTDWENTPFRLKVNGELRQESTMNHAILKANDIIHYVDQYFPILDGDIIYTGTPSGVGPLKAGDTLDLSFGPIHQTVRLQ